MRFDGFDTLEGRNLVLAYAAVALIQLGYATRVALGWLKSSADEKKAAKPL